MPAFSFEKIAPPPPHAPVAAPAVVRKQPGVIVQVLGRFARARRSSREDKPRAEPKPD